MADFSDQKNGIECDICLEYMNEKVFMCKGGHSLCCSCRRCILKCPFCQMSLESSTRNTALEALIQIIRTGGHRREIFRDKSLRCMQCKEIMDHKIGSCGSGHSFCWKCLDYNSVCKFCPSNKKCSRNYKLEEFIQNTIKEIIDEGIFSLNESEKEALGDFEIFRLMSIQRCCIKSPNELTRHILQQHKEKLKTIISGKCFRILLGDLRESVIMFLMRSMDNIFIINITYNNLRLILNIYQLVGDRNYRFGIRCPRKEDVTTLKKRKYVRMELGNDYIQKFKTGCNAGHHYVSLIPIISLHV